MDDRREAEMDPSDRHVVAEGAYETPTRPVSGIPQLSSDESVVLEALSAEDRCLTMGSLRARTGMSPEDLREAVEGLRAKGLITRLNTVVESYASRFPGLRVEGD